MTDGVVLKKVVPALGCVVANIMFASPAPAVLRVRRERHLGELNPLPFALMVAATLACTVYACVISDLLLFVTNFPGLLMSIFYVASCTPYASHRMREMVMLVYLGMTALVGGIALLDMLGVAADRESRRVMWGSMLVLLLAFYYAAPLSTLVHVLRSRCSASLHWPLCLANGVNGALWTAYGVAISDWFVAGPQAYGAAASCVALLLCLAFPRELPAAAGQQQRQQQREHKDTEADAAQA